MRRAHDNTMRLDAENAGRWYLLRDIFERLDTYLHFIKYVKTNDPEAYATHYKIGGLVSPHDTEYLVNELPPSWRHGNRPSFGMIMVMPGSNEEEDTISPAFGYFLKTRLKPRYMWTNADQYDCTIFYADAAKPDGIGVPLSFRVSVTDEGTVTLLKEFQGYEQTVRSKCRNQRGQVFTIAHNAWRYPKLLRWGFKDFKNKKCHPWGGDGIEGWAERAFMWVVNVTDGTNSGLLVRCKKDGVTVAFGVDLLRTPYFFKDRELYVNHNGRKKPIFHIVRTHKRISKGGSETFVKSHFRGLRRFMWNGFDVTVSMPGLHHSETRMFTAAGQEVNPTEFTPEMIELKDAASTIASHLDGNM